MSESTGTFDLDDRFAEAWPVEEWRNLTILVAVSGGADSVALLRMVHRLRTCGDGRVVVAHFNHGWRGKESSNDASFVEALADGLGLEYELGQSPTPISLGTTSPETEPGFHDRCNSEESARKARYEFLEATALRRGARYIVTAHTHDDQVETILHRLLRGTGIRGLIGIPRIRKLSESVSMVRPLLGRTRCEIESYLQEIGQPYRTDDSNQDSGFTRNRIRNELLPLLRAEYNPNVSQSIVRLGQLAGEIQRELDTLVELAAPMLLIDPGSDDRRSALSIRRDAARRHSGLVLRELIRSSWQKRGWPLQAMGAREWRLLESMALQGDPRHANFPGNVTATVDATVLTLRQIC